MRSELVSTHVFKNELCHMCGVLVLTHGTTRLRRMSYVTCV